MPLSETVREEMLREVQVHVPPTQKKQLFADNNNGIGVDGKPFKANMTKAEKKKQNAAANGGGGGDGQQQPQVRFKEKGMEKEKKKYYM